MRNNLRLVGTVLSTELIKVRRTVAIWLTFLYPAGAVILASLFHYANRAHVQPDQLAFINNFNGLLAFFLTFYAVLTVSFFCQIEHRNSMLKHLYALPLPRWAFYYGKLSAALLLLVFAWTLVIIFLYLSLLIMGVLSPKLQITAAFEHAYLFMMTGRTFLSAVALVVIQYILAMKLRNIVASVTIGIAMIILPVAILFILGITGLITSPNVLKWLPLYDPYAFPYSFVFNFSQGGSVRQEFFSMGLLNWFLAAIAISVLGYLEVRQKNIK